MSEVIFLSDVRLSFPHLIEPQVQTTGDGKQRISYSAELLMPESHPGYQAFLKEFQKLALEKGKENAQALINMIMADRKSRCFGKGEEKVNKKTFAPYDGYANNVYITAGRDKPPQIIQADGKEVDPTNTMAYQQLTRKMYGGCRVNVAIKPWWQNANPAKQYGHGIRCDLAAIQFLKDDTPFGEGRVDASGMFTPVQNDAPIQTQGTTMPPGPSFGNVAMPSFLGN